MDLFVSYETTTGLSYAGHLKKALAKIKKSAFVADDDIPKGIKWDPCIKDAIGQCRYLAIILTLGAILSPEQITPEIVLAGKLGKVIIPCKLRTVSRMMTRTLPLVYDLQQIEFTDKEDLAEQMIMRVRKEEEEEGKSLQDEAAAAELSNVQTAVLAMMVDNNLTSLPHPVVLATNDLGAFPDASSVAGSVDKKADPNGTAYTYGDKGGFLLFQHDVTADGAETKLVNYVTKRYSRGTCTVDSFGTVTQATTGY